MYEVNGLLFEASKLSSELRSAFQILTELMISLVIEFNDLNRMLEIWL